MAKRLTALAFAVLLTAGFVFAQELEISGEMKTGFYWEQLYVDGSEFSEDAKMHNNDDAGPRQGRFRLNLHVHNEHNMGMMVRFQQLNWAASQPNLWDYAMAYGNFIDNQLKVTVGKLGLSPWGADSIDLLKDELERSEVGNLGIRTEIMPGIVPGLDIGFVLNGYNNTDSAVDKNGLPVDVGNKLVDMLLETVLGVGYTSDYFHGSIAFRLDGEKDAESNSNTNIRDRQEKLEMVYRLEEKIIRQYLEGFSIWAAGYWRGIGESSSTKAEDSYFLFQNYLYIDYSPAAFSARLSGGLETSKDLQVVNGRVHFYYNVLPVLSVGTAFKYGQQFGDNALDKASWGVEPQLRVTFNPNAYIAFVYNYGQEYVFDENKRHVLDTVTQKPVFSDKAQWINLRVVYTF